MEGCFGNYSLDDDLSFVPSFNACLERNDSTNGTGDGREDEFVVTIVVGILLGLLILATVVGELFEIAYFKAK